jgi:hypothetical protein
VTGDRYTVRINCTPLGCLLLVILFAALIGCVS